VCGIFAYLSNGKFTNFSKEYLKIMKESAYNNKNRGPDNTLDLYINNKIYMMFHRLCINDLSENGNQPMVLNNCYLICNGEIFNHKDIINSYNFNTLTESDCEVILHLYLYLKCKKSKNIFIDLCNILDGEFAFVLYDMDEDIAFIARDPYGVRPLFIGKTENEDIVLSSELKGLNRLCYEAEQFKPGHYMKVYHDNSLIIDKYHSIMYLGLSSDFNSILKDLNIYFRNAVYKRMMSDKEVCSLLSGGLDSSLVSSILAEKMGAYQLKTFAIGIKGSPDLKNAQLVADHIKSNHYSIELTEEEFLSAIPEVIYHIESYDTTTVRASVGNYLVAKYIKENTDCKVVFNGDYADEVCGGYKYFKMAPTELEFHEECNRLLNDIHYYDCLRSDRSISSNGLEARVPFADKFFVDYYFSIPIKYRTSNNCLEKLILRKAFENDNLLPDEVLFRPKEAFSDGVTSETRSWHKIIQEHVDKMITDEDFFIKKKNYIHNRPVLKESFYYRQIFENCYKEFDNVIPYFWMPKWCKEVDDPSAREL